jgi:single-stranded-DNA-specific exonuclease
MKSYAVRDDLPVDHPARISLHAYPELLQHLLFHRGIERAEEAEAFLNPAWPAHLHDPYLMKDMHKAVKRVLHAIKNNEHIVVYTDYDADGIPAGVIFHDFFKKIGFTNFENYFPHRYEEGYGLNIKAVEKFAQPEDSVSVIGEKSSKSSKTSPPRTALIITADCGIADIEPVKRANELGMDVIITDHHIAQAEIPAAYAILNPKQPGCAYPYNMLCGSGIVFKFIQGILRSDTFDQMFGQNVSEKKNESSVVIDAVTKEHFEKWLMDMVGLATMADMVPLMGENRLFAYYGLMVLRKSPRLGLMKLLRKIKVNQRYLSEDDIGYMLVPRINAASRMGLPIEAFQLLTASNDTDADRMSDYLNRINDERKGLAAAITKEAKKHVAERLASEAVSLDKIDVGIGNITAGYSKKILVIGNPNWRPPLLGPVANSLADTYHMPVFLWGRADGEMIKGSCRSDGSVSLVELMQALPDGLLSAFGGHRASGGFSISNQNIHLLEYELMKAHEKISLANPIEKSPIYLDKKISLDEVNWNTYRMLEKLAPFGEGNSKPIFLFENALIAEVRRFGKEKNHLEIRFDRNPSAGPHVSAIGFFMTEDSFAVRPEKGQKIKLVANLEKSVFKNYPELRLRIVDIIC